jgi:hypothetical protein
VPRFSVSGAVPWRIKSERKVAFEERPDPAFSQTYTTERSAIFVDPGSKAGLHREHAATVQLRDSDGRLVVEKGLPYDVYRVGVSPAGFGVIFISRDCVVHGYGGSLESVVQVALPEVPEVQACVTRLQIARDELKNHIRCVALAADMSRYLLTIVDEAWCLTPDGTVLWGVRMPITEGWSRVSQRVDRTGTSAEVDHALRLMELWYPITTDGIRCRYRELAKLWHPDVNPNDSSANQKMQQLNAAVEVLTGADPALLAGQAEATYFEKDVRRERLDVVGAGRIDVSFGIVVPEKQAADWIYAAGFAATNNRTFLASYSGRVVEVGIDGSPMRVYDIGSVPTRIVDTEERLYILTDTRLYVLAEEKLHAVVDVFERDKLLVAQTGFALLGSKSLQLFRADGDFLGVVQTRDPIRRVYHSTEGLIVETRQHQAIIEGPPVWCKR